MLRYRVKESFSEPGGAGKVSAGEVVIQAVAESTSLSNTHSTFDHTHT